MVFWYPQEPIASGFYSAVPLNIPEQFIFYYEALCILSAFHHAANTSQMPICIAIYTDNSNTFDIFNSLQALPAYNHILKSMVDVLIHTNHQLRVLLVPGIENDIADALSQQQFLYALVICPSLTISIFEPPQLPLGAVKKMITSVSSSRQPLCPSWT